MKVVALICLLFVAGSCALPESEVAAPSQDRIADLFLLDFFTRVRNWLVDNGWAPKKMEKHEFHIVIINEMVEVVGGVQDFELHGLDTMGINNMYYNMLLTRMDLDVVMPKIHMSVGKYFVRIRYGALDVSFEVSGTLTIENIRLVGDALMPIYPRVFINNINANFSVGSIKSVATVIGTQDHSETVNEFINRRIPGFLATYSREINTIIGEVIREFVNWWWW